jgi:hypothetical protein
MKSTLLLAGASAIALGTGFNTAQAAAPNKIYGGGSTLAAKVYRDIFNCYSAAADGIFSTTPATYPTGASIAYPPAENAACTKQGTANQVTFYEGVGSGAGLAAWTTANPANFGSPATSNTIAYLDNNAGVGVNATPYPQIQFAGSDAYLNATQASQAQAAVNETVFQLPTFVTPITLPVGNIQNVKLTFTDVCNLFAGATNTTSGHVKISELVVRADGSGTSFILSDFLALNCPSALGFNSTNGFPSTKPNWTAVAAANGNHLSIVAVSGSGGVASTIASTTGALGYDSPDYVYPIVASSTAYPAYVNGFLPTLNNVKTHLLYATYPTSYNVATIGQEVNDSLANASTDKHGYPLVGYTFIDTYSCYSTGIAGGLIGGPAQGRAVLALANYLYGATTSNLSVTNILANQGFAQATNQVVRLLRGTGGPLNATGGIQNAACPTK